MSQDSPPPAVDITRGGLLGKLLRYSPIYLISSSIIVFTAFLLLPINTRIFNQEEYGAITTIDAAADFLVILVSLNLLQAYARYYHEYKEDRHKLRQYTSTIYFFIAGWGVLAVGGAVWAGGQWMPELIPVWPVLALAFTAPVLVQLGQLGGVYLQQNHRSGLQVALNLTNFLSHVFIMLVLAGVFQWGLTGKYIGVLCGALFSAAISTFTLAREGLLGFTFSRPMLLESLLFSIPLIPNITAGWITNLSDRLLLTIYGSLAKTGIYNVGYMLGRGISVFSEAIFMVYGPMIFAMLKKDPQVARQRIQRFVPYFFLLMSWLCLALALFAGEIVTIMVPKDYAGAASVVPVVLLAYFLGSQYKTFTFILSYQRKTWLISAGGILQALVNFIANLILIPVAGMMAAAWTTLAATVVYVLWMLFWSQKHFHLDLDIRRMLVPGGGILVAGGASLALVAPPVPGELSATAILVKGALLLLAAAWLWFAGGVLPEDQRQILARLRRR